MMEETKQYEEKLLSMQKYVPLLSKLIAQLEEKAENTTQSLAKINQLKILQQQLCDQEIGILLEELNKCEQILENIFALHDDNGTNDDESNTQKEKKEEYALQNTSLPKEPACHDFKTTSEKNNEQNICEPLGSSINGIKNTETQNIVESKQVIQTVSEILQNSENEAALNISKTAKIGEDSEQFRDVKQSVNNAEKTEKDSIKSTNTAETAVNEKVTELHNLIESTSESIGKQIENTLDSLDESFDEANVEIIEFSEVEDEESDGELIVPDEESLFISEKANESQEPHNETLIDVQNTTQEYENVINENSFNEEPKEKTVEQIDEEASVTKITTEKSMDEKTSSKVDELSSIIEYQPNKEGNEKPNASLIVEVENENQNDLCESTEVTENENQASQHDNDLPLSKKSIENEKQAVQTSDPPNELQNLELNSQAKELVLEVDKNSSNENGKKRSASEHNDDDLEIKKQKVSDLSDSSDREETDLDPLDIDIEITNVLANNAASHNDNDDIEIIEQRNSPILIDSDDDDRIIESAAKETVSKKPAFAFKSTNPNKIQNMNKKNAVNTIASTIFKIKNKNITPKTVWSSTKKQSERLTPQQLPPPHNQQTNFLSNIDLQPSQHNPSHFKTCVGQKTILIPNAFYGSRSHNPNTLAEQTITRLKTITTIPNKSGPDAAHCRWLNNFLHHFCSPRNDAHNTCYLMLQRALRKEDFERVYRQRREMNPIDNVINIRLLTQLRNIFYVNGDHKMQKLTFVGRKFCQFAFVNIMDKTISLTTDSITRVVTSRTRILEETLKAARTEILRSNNLLTNTTALLDNNLINQNSENPSITPLLQSSSSLRKRREDDTEYCPPHEIGNLSAESLPRRSLRTSTRRQSISENSMMFTYSDSDDEDNLTNNDETDPNEKRNREKPNVTAATVAFIIEKRLAAKREREQQAKSFETAFAETIPDLTDSTITEKDSEVFVISDDDDDVQQIPIVELAEPRAHLIIKASGETSTKTNEQIFRNQVTDRQETFSPKNHVEKASNDVPKNNSPEVHSMSRYNNHCLLCNRSITRVVGHYVNTHPENEVFISRPSPHMARTLLNNEIGLAVYDRLQNGLSLYIATCVFCEKKGSFSLPYWYQHFASHTGEYAYECNGCGLSKPTRSQLSLHVRQNCLKNGEMEVTQQYDLSSLKINGYTCRLCNYTQLNLGNLLKHLKNQHEMSRVEKHICQNVTLLEIPKSAAKGKQHNGTNKNTQNARTYVQGGNDEIFEIAEVDESDYTKDIDGQPVVVNEAEQDGSWYDGDPRDITDNMSSYMSSDTIYEIKNE